MMYNRNKFPLVMTVILTCIIGCLFIGLPLVNAQTEEALSEESLESLDNIDKSLDNIDELLTSIEETLAEMQAMIDDMTGKNDPDKAMITRDYFEEQMSSLEQRIVNSTLSLKGRMSSLRDRVSSIGDEILDMEDHMYVTQVLQLTLALLILLLFLYRLHQEQKGEKVK